MTDQETILAQFGAIELVLTTMCRMLPQVQRNALLLAVEAAEGASLNCTLSKEAWQFMLERARDCIGRCPASGAMNWDKTPPNKSEDVPMDRDPQSDEPSAADANADSFRCLREFERARQLMFIRPASDVPMWVWASPAEADLDSLIAAAINIDGEGALLTIGLKDAGVGFGVRGERYLVPWASLDPTALLRIREVMRYQAAYSSNLLKAAVDRTVQSQSGEACGAHHLH